MKLGAHQSIVGGFHNALEAANNIDLDCVQIFTKAPRNWKEPTVCASQISQFRTSRQQLGFDSSDVIVHASYLTNPCSANPETREKAILALQAEAQRCDLLGIQYLVFHPGSPGKLGSKDGIALVSAAIKEILGASSSVELLIENTAGTGKSVGHTFEQIQSIIHQSDNDPRIGTCFDTAHAFGAGYNLADIDTAIKTFEEYDQIIGLSKLKAIHLNDSRTRCGSRVDRHARIGNGHIGVGFFQWLINADFAKGIPGILETPLEKNETYGKDIIALKGYRKNEQLHRRCLKERTK